MDTGERVFAWLGLLLVVGLLGLGGSSIYYGNQNEQLKIVAERTHNMAKDTQGFQAAGVPWPLAHCMARFPGDNFAISACFKAFMESRQVPKNGNNQSL